MSSSDTLRQKLKRASEKQDELTFEVRNGENVLFESSFELPSYAEDVLKNSEESFYFYFKDIKDAFLKKLADEHQDMLFKQMKKEEDSRPALDDFSQEK